MAFDPNRFRLAAQTPSPNGGDMLRVFDYATNDAAALVLGANYFGRVGGLIGKGDRIRVITALAGVPALIHLGVTVAAPSLVSVVSQVLSGAVPPPVVPPVTPPVVPPVSGNAVPFRVPVSAATATGTTGDAAAASALAASSTPRSVVVLNVPAQGVGVFTLDVGAIGAAGSELYFTNMVNGGAPTWGFGVERSFDNGATWAALPGLPSAAAWAPWAPSGAPSTFNNRGQAFHVPGGVASRLRLTYTNTHASLTSRVEFRGLRDLNSSARQVVGVMGNSNAVSGENHRDWITEILALNSALDPMVMDLHRGSASVNEIRTEQAEWFLARFPQFTHLVHAENGNSKDGGGFSTAGVALNGTVQQHVDWYSSLYDLYEQYPGRVFVGPLEAQVVMADAATNLWDAIRLGAPGSGFFGFAGWNLWQRSPHILARSGLRGTSWDETYGWMRGGWDVFRLEDYENILGTDGNHVSGTTPNAKMRRGSRFAFAAIAGTAYKAPVVQLIEEAEATGTITAARRTRLGILLDYLDLFTPARTSGQTGARDALRGRLAAIGAGAGGGGGTGPSVTGNVADVPGNTAVAGQALTLAVSRSPAGASYVTLVNHDAEVQRVQLASGATQVTVNPNAASAAGKPYHVRFYDAATDELIDEVLPFAVTAAAGGASATWASLSPVAMWNFTDTSKQYATTGETEAPVAPEYYVGSVRDVVANKVMAMATSAARPQRTPAGGELNGRSLLGTRASSRLETTDAAVLAAVKGDAFAIVWAGRSGGAYAASKGAWRITSSDASTIHLASVLNDTADDYRTKLTQAGATLLRDAGAAVGSTQHAAWMLVYNLADTSAAWRLYRADAEVGTANTARIDFSTVAVVRALSASGSFAPGEMSHFGVLARAPSAADRTAIFNRIAADLA